MRKKIPSLISLRAFEAAARLGSFKEAANELAVTATAISHRIRALEEDLNCLLFSRQVRSIALTPAGEQLFTAVNAGFHCIYRGIEQLRHTHKTTVTLSVTPAFATKWLIPRLPSFYGQHPDIDLYIHTSNQPVDLNSGMADLAIRYGHGHYPDTISTLLLKDRLAPVANPALHVSDAFELVDQPLIHFEWHRPLPVDLTWRAWMRAAGIETIDLTSGIKYSEESHAIQAAIAGQGIGLVSLVLVEEELKLGLLKIITGPTLEGLFYHVVLPIRRTSSAATIAVKDWLLDTQASANV